jgi:NAD(P)-dependent dehydrogenase (short-subunit alcohol dehydrogenase family)
MNNTALVTGASRGIGAAVARRLSQAGFRVFAASRSAVAPGPDITAVKLDVTDHNSIQDAARTVHQQTGGTGLDLLVNAAGSMTTGPIELIPEEVVSAQFDVNVFGQLAVIQQFLPPMRQRGHGRIVNISSMLGRFALPGTGPYAASKYALEALTDALRLEIAPFGVRVVLVEPGVTDTGLYKAAEDAAASYLQSDGPYSNLGAGFPQRLLAAPAAVDDVAARIVAISTTSRPRARYLLGARNRLNTTLLTRTPTRLSDAIKTRLAHPPDSPK